MTLAEHRAALAESLREGRQAGIKPARLVAHLRAYIRTFELPLAVMVRGQGEGDGIAIVDVDAPKIDVPR